jgi:catechol 2,3-dioxygenase-like lactoylglutathione lyase family enzyme
MAGFPSGQAIYWTDNCKEKSQAPAERVKLAGNPMIAISRFAGVAGLSLLAGLAPARAQDNGAPVRPHILGVAQVAFFVHDIDVSRKYYHDFLGYDESFTLTKPDGSLRAALFKIDDHQTIELVPEIAPATDRLSHITLETDDVEAMRVYLKSRGIKVPDSVTKGQFTTAYFTVVDPDGHNVEFAQFGPGSGCVKDFGQHLPDTRISTHMSHAGISVRHLDVAMKFYGDVLGCRVTRRGSGNGKVLSWVNMTVPDGTDWVEFMLHVLPPPLSKLGVDHHFCLVVPDAGKAAQILGARPMPTRAVFLPKVTVGNDHKRKIQGYDPDGSRIEFMEPTTIDGLPSPQSTAPPPS